MGSCFPEKILDQFVTAIFPLISCQYVVMFSVFLPFCGTLTSLLNDPYCARCGHAKFEATRSASSLCSPTCRWWSGTRPVIRCGRFGNLLIRPLIGLIPFLARYTLQKAEPLLMVWCKPGGSAPAYPGLTVRPPQTSAVAMGGPVCDPCSENYHQTVHRP